MTKNKGGRPPITYDKFIESLPQDWEKKMIEMFAEGATDCEIQSEIGITQYSWEKFREQKDTLFSKAIKKGERLEKAWWLGKGRNELENRNFNSTMWYMNMKNRFGWKDKHEHTGDKEHPIAFTEFKEVLGKSIKSNDEEEDKETDG